MFRKLILSAVVATATVTGMTLTPAANAAPPKEFHHDHYGRYEVLVRHYGHWDVYGSYRNRFEADRVAEHLRCEGHRVEVRGC